MHVQEGSNQVISPRGLASKIPIAIVSDKPLLFQLENVFSCVDKIFLKSLIIVLDFFL